MLRKRNRRIQHDYNKKNFTNPFFSKRGKVYSKKRLKLISIISFVILISLFWFFFFCSIWNINKVNVEGTERLSSEEIKGKVYEQEKHKILFIIKETNIFSFDKQGLIKKMSKDRNIFKVNIKKQYPNTIKVIINERPYSFVFKQGDDYYYVSREGFILEKTDINDEGIKKYFIIENTSTDDFLNNKEMVDISKDVLQFIFDLNDQFKKHEDLPVDHFIIDQEFNTVKVKIKDGPLVFFSTKISIKQQINNLALVKKEKIRDNFNRLKYINLKYGDKLFYFPK